MEDHLRVLCSRDACHRRLALADRSARRRPKINQVQTDFPIAKAKLQIQLPVVLLAKVLSSRHIYLLQQDEVSIALFNAVRVLVRVPLKCLRSVGSLELVVRRVFFDAENFIVATTLNRRIEKSAR